MAKTKPKPARAGAARPSERDRQAALRVLTLESSALRQLAKTLDGSFSAALDRLEHVTLDRTGGRVIVTGMGKSGHVARKIAATLASTGTPAQFVHPAEASHGDLGMITPADVIVALSNSGETSELDDLVYHAKRFRIPLIAMVGRARSTLAQNADVALVLPAAPEACPMGLAPTTSTTMMLAYGDALAVALLTRKGFTSKDFQVLHPGGQLARKLLKVADVMHAGHAVPLMRSGASMREALIVMTAKTFGCVGITDAQGGLIGVITDGDLRRHMDGRLFERSVDEVMTRDPKTIRPGALAAEALGQMNAQKITALFVVDGRRVVGIVHMHDLLRAGVK